MRATEGKTAPTAAPAPVAYSPAAAERQLETFIARYSPEVAALARTARAQLRTRLAGTVEMVYDNYNTLAIGYGSSERASSAFISIALYPRWINLFFLFGATLPDPRGLLEGDGARVRHLRLRDANTLAQTEVQILIEHALAQSAFFDRAGPTRLIIKSISARQRPRRP